jgi:hypothetical protein
MAGWVALLPAAAASTARPAAATPAARPGDASTPLGGLTVQAPSRKAIQAFRAHVGEFVHGLARPGISGLKQFSQWDEPVCVRTWGLTPAFNSFVTKRIEALAVSVGAPDDKYKCQGPNVQVVFAAEPQKEVDDLFKRYPAWLGSHAISDTKALLAFDPPIKSWYISETLVYSPFRKLPPYRVRDEGGGPYGGCRQIGDCHFVPKLASRFLYAVVVIDAARTEGKAIGAVADEVAMIALSRPGPRQGCSPLPSVMDALDPSCPGSDALEGLTPWDEAFLKALYARHDTELLPVERTEIEQAVRAVGPPP